MDSTAPRTPRWIRAALASPWIRLAALVALLSGLGWTCYVLSQRPASDRPDPMAAALAAIEGNDLQTARRLLDALLERRPDHPQALLYRGQILRQEGDVEGALRDWRRIPDDPPDAGGTARHLEGTALLELNQARQAERKFLRAIELHPTYMQPRERLVELYVVQLRRNDVREQLRRIARLRAWTLNESVFSIVAVERATTPDAGAALMRSYLESDPDDRASAVALGQYLIKAERYSDSIAVLRPLVAETPRDGRAAGLLAEALVKQGDVESADEVLSAFAPVEDAAASLWRGLAHVALAREDWPRAAECLSQVLAAEPEDSASLYRLGRVYQNLGRPEEARKQLERAKRHDRMQDEALRIVWGDQLKVDLTIALVADVGDFLLELGRPAEAAEWFARVLSIQPRHPQALAGWQRASRSIRGVGSSGQRHRAPPAEPRATSAIAAKISRGATPPSPTAESPPAAIRLRDVQSEAGMDFAYFNGQTGFKHLVESTGGGAAVLDYDGDGWPDLFFPQGCSIPFDPASRNHTDRIYRNQGDGTFVDATAAAGTDDPRFGQGCSVGDYDNDGFPDLFVANYGRNTFYRNNGDGTFGDVTAALGLSGEEMSSSAALADLDRDGFLDLYVVNYVDSLKVCQNPDGTYNACNPSNFKAVQDRLYRNRADGTFEEITATAGVIAPDGKGLGVVVADFNNDDWPDIYVANDTTPNFLFLNRGVSGGPRFTEEGLVSGTALSGDGRAQAGMGVACADFDGNGRLDLYVTNFYQETNTLYLNQADAIFADATRSAGLAEPTHAMLGFGTQAADFDLDGRPDLFVANGHIDDFSFRGEPWRMPPQLFQNLGGGRFADISDQSGPCFQGEYLGRGVARLDWDRDLRPDLVVVHQDRPVALLKNETPTPGRSIGLELRGVESNRDAIGARLRLTTGGQTQVVEICGGDGFFASNERRQIIGLGSSDHVERLEIIWPSGRRQVFRDLPAGNLLTLTEGVDQPMFSPDPSSARIH